MVGDAACPFVKGSIVDDFGLQNVVFLLVYGLVYQMGEWLVSIKRIALFACEGWLGVEILVCSQGVRVDRAITAVGEEEFWRLQLHIELEVRGDYLQFVIYKVLNEDGGTCLFVQVLVPSYTWVYSRHWSIRSRGASFFSIFIF